MRHTACFALLLAVVPLIGCSEGVDREKTALRAEVAQLEKQLKDQTARLQQTEELLASVRADLHKSEADRRRAELAAEEARRRVTKAQAAAAE